MADIAPRRASSGGVLLPWYHKVVTTPQAFDVQGIPQTGNRIRGQAIIWSTVAAGYDDVYVALSGDTDADNYDASQVTRADTGNAGPPWRIWWRCAGGSLSDGVFTMISFEILAYARSGIYHSVVGVATGGNDPGGLGLNTGVYTVRQLVDEPVQDFGLSLDHGLFDVGSSLTIWIE